MADGKVVAQAVADARRELEDGGNPDDVFGQAAADYGVPISLLRRKFIESYGEPDRVFSNARWAQDSRGWKGRTFVYGGRRYQFIDMEDGVTAKASLISTGEVVRFLWPEIREATLEQWGL